MEYKFSDQVVLRLPYHTFYHDFSEKEIIEFFSNDLAAEALYLASPSLFERLKGLLDSTLKESKRDGVINSLLKYLIRFHSRSTPFGLFAGCAVLRTSKSTNIIIREEDVKISSKVDLGLIYKIIRLISNIDPFKSNLKYFPNNTIYSQPHKLRLIKSTFSNKTPSKKLSSIFKDKALESILNEFSNGGTANEIRSYLLREGANPADINSYIMALIEGQVLVSELELSSISADTLTDLRNVLIKAGSDYLNNFITILDELSKINIELKNSISYQNICNKIESKCRTIGIVPEPNRILQTNLYFDSQCEDRRLISKSLLDSLEKSIIILNKLGSLSNNNNLEFFKKQFIERYGYEEVPLLSALDIESGINYEANYNHNPIYFKKKEREVKRVKKLLLNKVIQSRVENLNTIDIDEQTVSGLTENWDRYTDSLSVMFKHHGKHGDKELLELVNIGGSSGASILARYAQDNKDIGEICHKIISSEGPNDSNSILAEIDYLPDDRLANVVIRPSFRDYEIPILNNSLPKRTRIELSDLLVSVVSDEVILRSKKLDKRVIPILTNAHNYSSDSLYLYKFLCDLQFQKSKRNIAFNWGNLRESFTSLPRVTIDNIILSPAFWKFEKVDFDLLVKGAINIDSWKKRFNLPDHVVFSEGDNELFINLRSKLYTRLFISLIKNKKKFLLKEFIFDKNKSIVKDDQGNGYVNEFIATLKRKSDHKRKILPIKRVKEKSITRNFLPGSEWVFYKLYCGNHIADDILIMVVKEFCHRLIKNNIIDIWFFIRYSDPENHLRIRFHCFKSEHVTYILEEFSRILGPFFESKLLWKLQLDTYSRELEKFGNSAITRVENVFFLSSHYSVHLLSWLKTINKAEQKWLISIKLIDVLLNSINYDTYQKHLFIAKTMKSNSSFFKFSRRKKIYLDKLYRLRKVELKNIIEENGMYSLPLFSEKMSSLRPLMAEILERVEREDINIYQFINNLIHLQINRLNNSTGQNGEKAIYYIANKFYKSKLAITKQI